MRDIVLNPSMQLLLMQPVAWDCKPCAEEEEAESAMISQVVKSFIIVF